MQSKDYRPSSRGRDGKWGESFKASDGITRTCAAVTEMSINRSETRAPISYGSYRGIRMQLLRSSTIHNTRVRIALYIYIYI